MRFFASWWERAPKHAVLTALVLGFAVHNLFGHLGYFVRAIVGPTGSYWN